MTLLVLHSSAPNRLMLVMGKLLSHGEISNESGKWAVSFNHSALIQRDTKGVSVSLGKTEGPGKWDSTSEVSSAHQVSA